MDLNTNMETNDISIQKTASQCSEEKYFTRINGLQTRSALKTQSAVYFQENGEYESPVLERYPLRIFLCGGQSTGKTTLLNDVLGHLNIKAETEIARKLIKDLGMSRADFDWKEHPDVFEKLQLEILKRQFEVEQKNARDKTDYISDRGIDPIVYAWTYLGTEARDRLLTNDHIREAVSRYRESLVFVLYPHQETLEDDDVRLVPTMPDLLKFTRNMTDLLESLHIPYQLIEKLDREERVEAVCQVVRNFRPDLLKIQ